MIEIENADKANGDYANITKKMRLVVNNQSQLWLLFTIFFIGNMMDFLAITRTSVI